MSEQTVQHFVSQAPQVLGYLTEQLETVRTGRATPALVQNVVVESYGSTVPLKQIANISAPDARTLQIQPWDRSQLGTIDKALQAANLGVNPTNDGLSIRLVLPQLTEERRKELVKLAKSMGEETRIRLRTLRQTHLKQLQASQKAGEISEPALKSAEGKIEEQVAKVNSQIEATVAAKETEILSF